MKKKFLYSLPMLGAVTLPIASVIACGGSKAVELDPAKKDSVILIVGQIGHKDKGFNQGAYDGTQQAINEIAKLKNYSAVKADSASDPDSKQAVNKALQAGAYIVIGAGYQYPGFMNETDFAGKYADREFIALDGSVNTSADGAVKKNVTTVAFEAQKAAFLAGVATGIYLAKNYDTYSGDGGLKVGAFGGGAFPPIKDMISGFLHGIAYYNDKLAKDENHKVKFVGWNGEALGFTGTFSPDAKSISTAKQILSKKIDVVFPVAGGQVNSMVDAIKNANAKTRIVGVDSDQTKVFGEDGKLFITSAMKSTKVAALEAFKAIYGVQGAKVRKGVNNVVGLDGKFVGIAEGVFGKDDFKGTSLSSTIKNDGGIDTDSTKNIYQQLTEEANDIYEYAERETSTNWLKAKVIFAHNGDKIPKLADFQA